MRSTLDCSTRDPAAPAPPAAGTDLKERALTSCAGFFIDRDGTMYGGGVTMAALIRMLVPAAGRPIVDRTGLDGFFSVTLRFERIPSRTTAEPPPNAPPNVFTALQEQLGLKLEPDHTQVQTLVIDHIEHPIDD